MPGLSKPLVAGAALFARNNSCAMLSAAITAMRSLPATFAESLISRIRWSRNCTASSSSSRSASLHATRYSWPRIDTSSVSERSSMKGGSIGGFGQLLQESIESRRRGGHARGERPVLLLSARELALQRFVFCTYPMVVGKQYREFLLEPGDIRVHDPL